MRKTIAIFLLLLFAFNTGGFLFVFKIQQIRIRKEVKHQIKIGVPDADLTVIVVSEEIKNEIDWKNEGEFSFRGVMYDIVRKSSNKNGNLQLYCITDTQETLLFADLNKQVNKQMETRKKDKNTVNNLFKLLTIIQVMPEYKYSECLIEIKKSDLQTAFYLSPSLDILIPPPKMV